MPPTDTDPLFSPLPAPPAASPTSARRILIVDDEPGPRMALHVALGEHFEVTEASGGREAIARVAETSYDLVLLDIRMPGMNGFHTLEEIRRLDPPLTVVMFTGVDSVDEVRKSMRLGARYFIPKVQPLSQLLESIHGFIDETAVKRGEARLTEETRRIAEELRQERLTTLPKVWQSDATSCFMHDLSSPLLTIDICQRVLQFEIQNATTDDPALARLHRTIERLGHATTYCRQLATHWRTLHRHAAEFEAVDLAAAVRRASDIALLPPTSLEFIDSPSALILGSPLDLTRLFQNLIANACQAHATRITVGFALTPDGRRVQVRVTDDGEGMSSEVLARIQEANHTTKTEGLGLGMEIVRQIAQVHGASLSFDSRPGAGSVVALDFPHRLSPAFATVNPTTARHRPPPGSPPQIRPLRPRPHCAQTPAHDAGPTPPSQRPTPAPIHHSPPPLRC